MPSPSASSDIQLWAFPAESESNFNSDSRSSLQKKDDDDDHDENLERELQRYRAAFYKCCPCSCPVMTGIVVGTLIMGVVLATVLSLYLVQPTKATSVETSTIRLTTGTTVTTTSATTTTATTSTSVTSVTTSTTSTTRTTSTSSTSSTSSATTATTTTSTTATTTTTTKPYCTTRVTFDDIPGQSDSAGTVPNGYKNLNWTNVEYVNASSMPSTSGYNYGVSSPPYVAHNANEGTVMIRSANGTRFSFDSVVVTAGWRDSLLWSLYIGRGAATYFLATFTLSVVNRTTISCGSCTNFDTLYFTSGNGTPSAGLPQNGTQFPFDDLCISFGF